MRIVLGLVAGVLIVATATTQAALLGYDGFVVRGLFVWQGSRILRNDLC